MLQRHESMRHLRLDYIAAEEFKLPSQRHKELFTLEEHAFGFVLQEKVKIHLQVNEQQRTGTALCGELFMLPPHSRCALENRNTAPAHLLIIRFQCTPRQLLDDVQLYCFRMPQIRSWIQDFLSDGGSMEPALYYQLQSHLYAMVAALMMYVQKPREMEQDLVDYVEQTRQYMLRSYQDAMDMEDIARLSGASPSRFYQAFRRQTGLSPHKFITKIRLDASLSLLANTMSPVIEVAHSVGYPDEYYFSRLFKKHMGMTPTDYAARTKKKIACLSPVLRGDLAVLGITPHLCLERGWMDEPAQALKSVASSEPELILTPPVTEEIFRALGEIAPVVKIEWKKYPWKERLMDISQLFDLSSIAERWLSYFDMKVENARFHIRQHLGQEPVLLVHASNERRFRVFGMQMKKMKDLFYDDLQVTPPDPAHHIGAMDVTSLSDVAALDCDNVLFLVGAAKPEAFCDHLAEHWKELKQTRRSKRCFFIRHDDPLLYNASAHEGLVDQTVQYLLRSGT
ncbi:hypothetical protein GCM10023310_09780 [Paenibacillus vulneris]|uniref:AraC family transcriptional regulator n=1 Tax=Paenibacillus vulneris TaxID=1133364 RepID=A0ABW3UXW5_9BACL